MHTLGRSDVQPRAKRLPILADGDAGQLSTRPVFLPQKYPFSLPTAWREDGPYGPGIAQQWIEVDADIPKGTSLLVETATAETRTSPTRSRTSWASSGSTTSGSTARGSSAG